MDGLESSELLFLWPFWESDSSNRLKDEKFICFYISVYVDMYVLCYTCGSRGQPSTLTQSFLFIAVYASLAGL